jgi:hypothetical protein
VIGGVCLAMALWCSSAPPGGAAPLAIGRLQYDGGGDWYANPSSLPNLLAAVRERTTLSVADREVVVRLTDDRVWSIPYLYMTGHGNVRWSDAELAILRRWLRQGGFLHVDDNYGMDESIRREIARLFPGTALEEVPLNHPIYNLIYQFPQGIPKIHEHDGKPAQGFGLFLDGRLVIFYSYQSDLGDGWEDPGTTILLKSMRRRSGWASTSSHTPSGSADDCRSDPGSPRGAGGTTQAPQSGPLAGSPAGHDEPGICHCRMGP